MYYLRDIASLIIKENIMKDNRKNFDDLTDKVIKNNVI